MLTKNSSTAYITSVLYMKSLIWLPIHFRLGLKCLWCGLNVLIHKCISNMLMRHIPSSYSLYWPVTFQGYKCIFNRDEGLSLHNIYRTDLQLSLSVDICKRLFSIIAFNVFITHLRNTHLKNVTLFYLCIVYVYLLYLYCNTGASQ